MLAIGLVAVLSTACAPVARAPAPARTPAFCAPATPGALQEITGTPASPYFVHQPVAPTGPVPTVVFLPGVRAGFPKDVLFEFWARHSRRGSP